MFEEKTPGKCKIYIGIAVMPKLCCPIFHFHQIYYNATNTFGKKYLNSELQVC